MLILKLHTLSLNYSLLRNDEVVFESRKRNKPWYSSMYEGNINGGEFEMIPNNVWRPFKLNNVFKDEKLIAGISYKKNKFIIDFDDDYLKEDFELKVIRRFFKRPNFELYTIEGDLIFKINKHKYNSYLIEELNIKDLDVDFEELIFLTGFCVVNGVRMAQHGYV